MNEMFPSVLLFVLALLTHDSAADLSCKIVKSKSSAAYQLSTAARNGINYHSGQSGSSFQALECKCSGNSGNVLDANTVNDFDDNSDLKDWDQSAVFLIKGCADLEVNSLDQGSNNDLATALDRRVLIFEDINLLEFTDSFMESLAKGTGTKENEETWSSIYFRNVELFNTPSASLKFGEKVEVLFQNVTLGTGDKFNMEFTNINNQLAPIIRIENSVFPSVDASNGLDSGDGTFNLKVFNEQKAGSNGDTECNFNYKGKIHLINNTFGALPATSIEIDGAEEFKFHNNKVTMAAENALKLDQIKKLDVRNNHFGFVFSHPIFDTGYDEFTQNNNCPTDGAKDIEEKDVSMTFSNNHFPHFDLSPIAISFESTSFSDDFIKKKLASQNNTASQCDCTTKDDSLDETNEFGKIMSGSRCSKILSDAIVVDSRNAICNEEYETPEERDERIEKDTKKKWTIYLVVAVVVTLILTAILTAIIMRMCCGGNNDVTPRSR